jgi:hypothetical protein
MIKEVSESNPEVGSSSMITCGSLINSKAIDVLFLSPPEMPLMRTPPTMTSRHFSSFNFLQRMVIFSVFYSSDKFNFRFAAN